MTYSEMTLEQKQRAMDTFKQRLGLAWNEPFPIRLEQRFLDRLAGYQAARDQGQSQIPILP